jgi:hypothetical protein
MHACMHAHVSARTHIIHTLSKKVQNNWIYEFDEEWYAALMCNLGTLFDFIRYSFYKFRHSYVYVFVFIVLHIFGVKSCIYLVYICIFFCQGVHLYSKVCLSSFCKNTMFHTNWLCILCEQYNCYWAYEVPAIITD